MPAQTAKGKSIAKFIEHESGSRGPWMVRVVDGQDSPALKMEAFRDDAVETGPDKTFEVQSEQVRLYDDEIDEATKTMIRGWLASLSDL